LPTFEWAGQLPKGVEQMRTAFALVLCEIGWCPNSETFVLISFSAYLS